MCMKTWKQYIPDVLAVLLFAAVSFAYFFPADLEGKILYRHDSAAGRGAVQEINEYRERTGENSRWTNSLFSGMPTYQTAPSYKSAKPLSIAMKAYHLWLPENVWYIFAYMIGFYILLRVLDVKRSLAVLGALIWAFSSYFFIIIAAGHIWKVMALAYVPPMIAGIVLAYKGKYLWGLAVTSLFAAFEINANHVQMTYYFLFVVLFLVIAWLVEAVIKRRMTHFLKATGVCIAAAVIAVCLNLSNLYHTWQYSLETMRGKSELVKENTANQTDTGLDRDYITQWSYGIDETLTLLIPNAKGGASMPLMYSDIAEKKAEKKYRGLYRQMGQYWGNQPSTSGPVYVGAFVLMLFILGLFIVKGPLKWGLLAATVLSVLLAWGRNFMPFTNFFIDYIPMYAKFRTVASILVVAEFTIPLLAVLALKEITTARDPRTLLTRRNGIYIAISFLLTGGLCLLLAVAPGTLSGDLVSHREWDAMRDIPKDYLAPMLANLREIRLAIFTADCWRSFYVVIIGTALLLLSIFRKMRARYFIGAVVVLCLVDMWQVNKRYLNNDMFVRKSARELPQEMTKTDEYILQDNTDHRNYRVLNLSTNTFNENETSYFHKSIGGYHAAKLRRYQELIDAYIEPEMVRLGDAIVDVNGDMTRVVGDSIHPVLNMLNMRYVIMPLQRGETVPLKNTYALGNAWFVDNVTYCDNANQELERIGTIDLRHEAAADKRFEQTLGTSHEQSGSTVTLTSYAPNKLTYDAETATGGVIVFSEIYYPGWTATVDGAHVDIGRVNYVLRAINVDAGKHSITLSFHPASIAATETVAYAAYALLLLVVALAVVYEVKKKKTNRVK